VIYVLVIITLYGPDILRRKRKLDELIAEYRAKKPDLTREVIDGTEDGAVDKALVFLKTPSLFQETKLLIIKNAIGMALNSAFKKLLKSLISSKETTIIFSDETKQIRKDLAFLKEKPNLWQEFSHLSGDRFLAFVTEEAGRQKVNIGREGLKCLAEGFSGDSWGVSEEIAKLALLGVSVVTDGVIKNCGVRADKEFFFYITNWSRKLPASRLKILEELFILKNDPAKIFNILAYQNNSQLRNFADYDVEVKSGRLEYEEVLVEIALE